MRMAAISVLQGVYLFPVYATSGGDLNHLESVTLANIPQGDPALLAATVACYIVYSFALYLLYKELMWYTERRHLMLLQPRVENYTVHVKFIPTEWQSNQSLQNYFSSIFGPNSVFEAQMAYQIPILEKAVADRDALCGTEDTVGKLEHALNVQQVKGVRPKHKKLIIPDVSIPGTTRTDGRRKCGCKCRPPTETVDSINEYTTELEDLNEKIESLICDIESKTKGTDEESFRADLEAAIEKSKHGDEDLLTGETEKEYEGGTNAAASTDQTEKIDPLNEQPKKSANEGGKNEVVPNEASTLIDHSSSGRSSNSNLMGITSIVSETAKGSANKLISGTENLVNSVGSGAQLVGDLITSRPDGEPRSAGFVSFTTLKAKTSALQMLHHPKPFCLDVEVAPSPSQIVWANVGMAHKVQQVGRWVAIALTTVLCLFWTVIVSFVTSLGEVENLTVRVLVCLVINVVFIGNSCGTFK